MSWFLKGSWTGKVTFGFALCYYIRSRKTKGWKKKRIFSADSPCFKCAAEFVKVNIPLKEGIFISGGADLSLLFRFHKVRCLLFSKESESAFTGNR